MSIFIDVYASNPDYKLMREKYKQELDEYQRFSDKINSPDTGKIYRGYLIKLLVNLKKIKNIELEKLITFETVEQLNKLTEHEDFIQFNEKNKYNYSACLGTLRDLVNSLEQTNYFSESITDIRNLISSGVTQLVLTGAPGTGKTYMATRIASDLSNQFAHLTWKESDASYELVQFHPSYDYTDFIEGLRPIEIDNKMVFKRIDGQFKRFCRDVIEHGDANKKYLFIIDEINRADLSKVFGELMYSLETDKRGSNHRIMTQYDNLPTYDLENKETLENDVFKDGFYIPENIIIIATMNDIDRSVESMDFALRRRFHWYEVEVTDYLLEDAFSSKTDDEYNYFSFIEDEKLHEQVRHLIINQVMKMNREVIGAEKYHLNDAYYISQGYFKHLPDNWVNKDIFESNDVIEIVEQILTHE